MTDLVTEEKAREAEVAAHEAALAELRTEVTAAQVLDVKIWLRPDTISRPVSKAFTLLRLLHRRMQTRAHCTLPKCTSRAHCCWHI